MKKIAIVGAGWYGCYAACRLASMGQTVDLYEYSDRIFSGASGSNQNRLHLGFHYPRCKQTRKQSRLGFEKFLNNFESLTTKIERNIYAVPFAETNVTFSEYMDVYAKEGYEFSSVNVPRELNQLAIAGAIAVPEMLIDPIRSKLFWENELKNFNINVFLNCPVTQEQFYTKKIYDTHYDVVIDCTWLNLNEGNYNADVFYELCIYFELEAKVDLSYGALTLMDGNFFSIYPTPSKDLFTFTSVMQTPIAKNSFPFFEFNYSSVNVKSIFESFLEEAKLYYPKISDDFVYHASKFSQKTKPVSTQDTRTTLIERIYEDRFSVMSGKIDTIFELDPILMEISHE